MPAREDDDQGPGAGWDGTGRDEGGPSGTPDAAPPGPPAPRAPGDYEVGRGRPPKHTRFQPGRSGNPRGRPKALKSVRRVVEDELFARTRLVVGGRVRQVSFLEAAMLRLKKDVLEGKAPAMAQLLRLLALLEDGPGPNPGPGGGAGGGGGLDPDAPLSPSDEALLAAFVRDYVGEPAPEPQPGAAAQAPTTGGANGGGAGGARPAKGAPGPGAPGGGGP